jgi:segregation and condensation protein A
MQSEMSNKYQVKTEVYEGPFDVLLHLIEKRKLFINDISLAEITDDFIEYVQSIQDLPLKNIADFIVIASTLVLIKSKSLMPVLDLTEEEEMSIDELEARLREYREIKRLSRHVGDLYGKQIIFSKKPSEVEPVFSPEPSLTKENLYLSALSLISSFPKKEDIKQAAIKKVISLEEMMSHLTERVKASFKLSFRNFSDISGGEKINVIVSFLAVLELVKRGLVSVSQDREFEDFDIENQDVGVPNYH